MIYLDTETCGFHGMPVLLQYAEGQGDVHLHSIWTRPIHETLDIIRWICDNDVCGFNLAFDWFHLCKCYTTFVLYPDHSATPEDIIDDLAVLEEQARFSDVCLKPKRACDLMLHARRGPYQSLMERDDIRIRRVPTAIAWHLARELEKRIVFDDIYFARRKDKYAPRWKIYDIKTPDGNINPDFKDIKLRFQASGSLKNLYRHAFKISDPIFTFKDVEVDSRHYPVELGYAPFALAIGTPDDWKGTWPDKIGAHISHWGYNADARKYAGDDVVYTRRLHIEHFNSPEPGDNDSELACSVAACRWRGYAINGPEMLRLKNEAQEKIARISKFVGVKNRKPGKRHAAVPPKVAKRYLLEVMDDNEKMAFAHAGSTKKVLLKEMAKGEFAFDDCIECNSTGKSNDLVTACEKCGGIGRIKRQVAIRAQEILDAREAEKEVELYDKLLTARRFHASFKVTGTLSNRMAGADGLNPQGIKHEKRVRAAFLLADAIDEQLIIHLPSGLQVTFKTLKMLLGGGDFKAFEVTIAAKVFNDPKLNEAITSGKKIHALLGMEIYPGNSYEQILESEGSGNDMYSPAKSGVFLMFYGGDENTFKSKLGIPLEIGKPAFDRFINKYRGIKIFGEEINRDFLSLRQAGGIGTKIEYHEPKDYAESFLGFRRYFTLENRIVKELFELAQDPPAAIRSAKIRVLRRDRLQTAGGAAQSALYGAAFGIVSGIIRAVKNHYIQSPGADITKAVQKAVWDLQPCGIHEWYVQPLNIHDELMCPMRVGMEFKVATAVNDTVAKYKKLVPLLAIDWIDNIPNWAGKKG